MRELLIFDPTLMSLEGHSYHYTRAVAQAAGGVYDNVVIYADRRFVPSSQDNNIRCELNRVPFSSLKKIANGIFHFRRKKKKLTLLPGHATVLAEVPSQFLYWGKKLRALDLTASLRRVLSSHRQHTVEVFIQHTRSGELLAVEAVAKQFPEVKFHLVLRYTPEFIYGGFETDDAFKKRLGRLLSSSGGQIRFYTDSELLSKSYAEFLPQSPKFPVVPIPVSSACVPSPMDHDAIRVAMLGPSRIEKGFGEIKDIIAGMPRSAGNRPVIFTVQISSDSADPRVQEHIAWLKQYKGNLALELLEGPVSEAEYFFAMSKADILLAPYTSPKYAASTSSVFVEALHMQVPMIVQKGTWMAREIAEAAAKGLRIGEIMGSATDLSACIERISVDSERYRKDLRAYLDTWKSFHTPQRLVEMLVAA